MSTSREHSRLRVFISHQWTDKQLADRLARDLEPLADVWMDYRALRPGDRIQHTIDNALADTDIVLVVWTTNASRSAGVAAEIDTSRRLGLRIVPCLFEFDADGRPTPPLPDSLVDVLGVDFHHYGSGLAQLANLIIELEAERLPEHVQLPEDDPARRMIEYLRGYLSYLANYRALRNVPDERGVWIDRIIGEIERFLRTGGDPALVRGLVQAAEHSGVDDPEGIGELVRRLEAALAESTPAPGNGAAPADAPQPATNEEGPSRPRDVPIADRDELRRRVAAVFGPDQVDAAVMAIDRYLQNAVPALQALQAFARRAASPAGIAVVEHLRAYLAEPEDLIPDNQGRYGRLDDAWLILNTAYRLIESGLASVETLPVEWPTIIAADQIVRAVLPPAVLEELSNVVYEMLRLIQAEVEQYSPVLLPSGRGYAPHISESGGTWEDRMNRALLGTGLSVDG